MSRESVMVLHGYWRSSAAYRVRIALNLKGLEYEQRTVDLVKGDGEQHLPAYRALNPQGLVPALVHEGATITQSLAICEYLEERFPRPALLAQDASQRARQRAMALTIACDIHPLNNLRVQQYLKRRHGIDGAGLVEWMNHWVSEGFAALERSLEKEAATPFCHGEFPGLADCFLVPQVYNAERFQCDLTPFSRICKILRRCRSHPAFKAAAPESQPDAPGR